MFKIADVNVYFLTDGIEEHRFGQLRRAVLALINLCWEPPPRLTFQNFKNLLQHSLESLRSHPPPNSAPDDDPVAPGPGGSGQWVSHNETRCHGWKKVGSGKNMDFSVW